MPGVNTRFVRHMIPAGALRHGRVAGKTESFESWRPLLSLGTIMEGRLVTIDFNVNLT
jgi:hypothetical protein